ncbi:MAG: alpha/beta fold hydrolase, partial [Caldilineaceae bacterium]|nr:alpha/beta fold hydrolase [Caldilineaceae bacterium]
CDVEYATQQNAIRDYVEEYSHGAVNPDSAVNKAMYAICLDRFAEAGADLSQYNTINNARDVKSIVQALGYDAPVNLFGFSYGTQVALEVMRQHPEIVRSAVLDSVAPASLKLYENMGQPNVEAITSLLDLCAADGACNQAYPGLRQRFGDLLNALDEEPLQREDGSEVTTGAVVDALRQSDIRQGLGAYFPLMIWELEQGRTDTLDDIQANRLPPPLPEPIDPTVLRYAGIDLPDDALFLIETALSLREEAQSLTDLASRLLRRGDDRVAEQQSLATPAGRFDKLFFEVLEGRPFDERLALNRAYLAFPIEDDGLTVDGLQAFIRRNFDGYDASRLNLLAGRMDDEDVAALAEIIFGKARGYATYFNVSLALNLIVCQEHIPFNTLEGATEAFKELELPQVARGKWGTVTDLLANCDLFPSGLEPEDFHEPVLSAIPTLVMIGTADTQTAGSWGVHAAETLENSQVVRFPETGHGAIRFSQCARDIAAAFLNGPQATLDTSCTELLAPQFELPPEQSDSSDRS